MPESYAGTVVELGGEELGASGHPKPRKVVVKADPTAQYGKTFRVWEDSDAWSRLSKLNGQHVTILFDIEERPGGPKGTYTQNMIVGVDAPEGSDGAGSPPQGSGQAPTPAPSDASTWATSPPTDTWSKPVQTVTDPTLTKDDYWNRKEDKDEERNKRMAVAWAIGQAIQLGHKEPDHIESFAHQLLILQDRMVSELSS